MSDEQIVTALLSAAGLSPSPEETATFVEMYPMVKMMVDMLYAVDAARLREHVPHVRGRARVRRLVVTAMPDETGDETGTSREFQARLDGLVGKPVGSGQPSVAPDPVNQPMIRHWAAAFEDANPVYTDPEFAAASRFGGIVAPPLMLQTWTMATPQITGIAERGGAPVEPDGASPLAVFDDAGFTGTLASNSEFEIDPLPARR